MNFGEFLIFIWNSEVNFDNILSEVYVHTFTIKQSKVSFSLDTSLNFFLIFS